MNLDLNAIVVTGSGGGGGAAGRARRRRETPELGGAAGLTRGQTNRLGRLAAQGRVGQGRAEAARRRRLGVPSSTARVTRPAAAGATAASRRANRSPGRPRRRR